MVEVTASAPAGSSPEEIALDDTTALSANPVEAFVVVAKSQIAIIEAWTKEQVFDPLVKFGEMLVAKLKAIVEPMLLMIKEKTGPFVTASMDKLKPLIAQVQPLLEQVKPTLAWAQEELGKKCAEVKPHVDLAFVHLGEYALVVKQKTVECSGEIADRASVQSAFLAKQSSAWVSEQTMASQKVVAQWQAAAGKVMQRA